MHKRVEPRKVILIRCAGALAFDMSAGHESSNTMPEQFSVEWKHLQASCTTRGRKFPGGASSLCGLGLGLKFPGSVCLGDMERAAPLRDLVGRRDLCCGVVVRLLLLREQAVPPLRRAGSADAGCVNSCRRP